MYKYKIVVYWSEKDNTFVAEVPELPGCVAHGSSQKDALKNINESIQLWINTVRKHDDPVPEPKCYPQELWVHQNPEISRSIQKGIQDVKEGRVARVKDLDKFFEEL